MSELVIYFNASYGGRFVKSATGEVGYTEGEFKGFESRAEDFFCSLERQLGISLYGQRMWYKLPFEDLKELKILCDGTENVQRMIDAAIWTKCVDIYLEKDGDEAVDAGQESGDEVVDAGQQSGEEAIIDDVDEAAGSDGLCPEETRVEKLMADVLDDEDGEENLAYMHTPPPSDGEEEEEETVHYERWRRGSELAIRQVFDSVEEFKEAVLEYALNGGWNIKYTRWGGIKCEAKCAVKGEKPCPWRIYCSFEKPIACWMVKTYKEQHTCTKDGRCKLLSEGVIAKLIVEDIRNTPSMMPKAIQAKIEERYNLLPSDDQCRKAIKRALDLIQDEYDEQYARLKDYKLEILDSNPGSTVDLRTTTKDGCLEVFDRFYVCFAGLRKSWVSNCRPIFGIDGCFLKSTSKGQLLAAVGRDANNQIYPISWAVVQQEDTESWLWFIEKLQVDLKLGNGEGFTLISDRQKGLLIAVNRLLPNIEHRMCARHIYGNLRKFHSKKSQIKTIFWEIVRSFNKADYEQKLEKLKACDTAMYEAMMQRNPTKCCRAFFKTESCCEDALNNFSESYNSAIEKARAMPLVEMLETMRRQTMVRIELRKIKIGKWHKKYTPKVANVIAEEEKERRFCNVIPSCHGLYEVIERGTSYKVNMRLRTCSCRRWDLTGIPCRHALRVVLLKKQNSEDYVSDWYLTSRWVKDYEDTILPMNGMKFWKKSGGIKLAAPPRVNSKGRNKKPQKRMKAINESPTKGKKVTNHGRDIQCYRCGEIGHNSAKCKNAGVPNKPRKPKKPKTTSGSAERAECDGGSQPTQPSPME